MAIHPGTGDDGRFVVPYSAREIIDRLDRIESRLDQMTGRDTVYKLLAGLALGGLPAALLTYLVTSH